MIIYRQVKRENGLEDLNMEIKDNVVSFTLDEKSVRMLELALLMLQKDGDELFKDFVERTTYIALRNSVHENQASNSINLSSTRIYREGAEDKAKRRINIWSHRKDYVNYNIIRAYFKACDATGTRVASRETMKKIFSECTFFHPDRNNEETFLRNFRMMCSDSAYGLIFKYNQETDEVSPADSVADFLLERKDIYTVD